MYIEGQNEGLWALQCQFNSQKVAAEVFEFMVDERAKTSGWR